MKMNKEKFALGALIGTMTVFGTVGILSKNIPLPSGAIALARSVIGFLFLVAFMLVKRAKPNLEAIKKNLTKLILSGICLGANWIFFFSACKVTTIATATLSYYLAPTFIILTAVFIFSERLTPKKGVCVALALFGMVLVSGVLGDSSDGVGYIGIAFGLVAAALYAAVVILNKLMSDIDPIEKTLVQFFVSSVVLLPYVFFFEDIGSTEWSPKTVIFLLVLGVVHTGIAYVLYFGSASILSAQTMAIYSYIDPIVSIIVSVLIFSESIGVGQMIGAVLIIGSALVAEVDFDFKKLLNANKGGQK